MFEIINFGFFIIAVLLLNATPGPDTAYIVVRSVAQGRRAGLMSAVGISADCCVHALACAVGLTAVIAASATVFVVVKFFGAAYLVYLGVRMLLSKEKAAYAAASDVAQGQPRALRQLLLQGFTTNLLNPKVVLFFVSFFPQFISPGNASHVTAFLILGAVFVVMSLAWNCMVAWIAGSVTQRLSGTRGMKVWLDRVVGCAFVGLGLRLTVATR